MGDEQPDPGSDSDADDLVLPDAHVQEVNVVLAGLAVIQTHAFSAGDVPKVVAAGKSIKKLAESNPDQVREAFLRDQEAFKISNMPDEVLEILDLEIRDGTLYEHVDDGDWTEVDIDE